MDTFEVLNNLLVKLFNDILDVEEKALITDEFKDISVTDMHIILNLMMSVQVDLSLLQRFQAIRRLCLVL